MQFVLDHNVDIILLNETMLINTKKFYLPKFFSYFTNIPHNLRHVPFGGTAVFINRRLIHRQIKINNLSNTNTSVHIRRGNSEIHFATVYKSPNTTLQTADFDALLNTPVYTFIVGGLNCKYFLWNTHFMKASGRILAKFFEDHLDTIVSASIS